MSEYHMNEYQNKWVNRNLGDLAIVNESGILDNDILNTELIMKAFNPNPTKELPEYKGYSESEQDEAFQKLRNNLKRVKLEDVQDALLGLKSYSKKDKNGRKVLNDKGKEIISSLRSLQTSIQKTKDDKQILSEQLQKQIRESGYAQSNSFANGLANVIDGLSDKDLKEYLWANRAAIRKMALPGLLENTDLDLYTTKAPDFANQTSVKDMFKEDPSFMENPWKMTPRELEVKARQFGMTRKELIDRIAKEKLEYDRQKIYEGQNIGEKLSRWMLPNMSKAVLEGRDPSGKEWAKDMGANAIYATPWGRVLGTVGSKLPKLATLFGTSEKVKPFLQFGASNATAPFANEAWEEVVDPEDKDFGEHLQGGLVGTAINAGVPLVFKGAEKGLKRGGVIGKSASGETAKEIVENANLAEKESLENAKKVISREGSFGDISTSDDATLKYLKEPLIRQLLELKDKKGIQLFEQIASDVASSEGRSLNEKIANAPLRTKYYIELLNKTQGKDKTLNQLNNRIKLAYGESVYKAKPYNPIDKTIDTFRPAVSEAYEYGANLFGDVKYKDEPESVPFFGKAIPFIPGYQSKKDKELEKKKKQIEDTEKKWKDKWKVDFSSIW